jgi:hypothetical protein
MSSITTTAATTAKSSTKPAVLLAHGSFHKNSLYEAFLETLRTRGFQDAICPQLPTSDPVRLVADPNNPSFDQLPPEAGVASQSDDVNVLGSELKRLVEDEGKEVLLIAHSSGSWSATECALPTFHRSTRQRSDLPGGIIGIFYIAAILVQANESVFSTLASIPTKSVHLHQDKGPWIKRHGPSQYLATLNNPSHFLFHDLPPTVSMSSIEARLTASPQLKAKLKNCVYGMEGLVIGYLLCEGDRVLPLEFQESMVRSVEKGGAKVELYRSQAGHEPFLSQEKLVAEAVEDFAKRCEQAR